MSDSIEKDTGDEAVAPPPHPGVDSPAPRSSSTTTAADDTVTIPYDPDEYGFRRIVRNFTPSWYVVTMGTGIVSTLFYQIYVTYAGEWLHVLAIIFFVLNVLLFATFSIVSGLRYAMYPELFGAMLRNPKQRLFIGTVPTSLFTIVNMIVAVCVPAWGRGFAVLAWVLWWITGIFSAFLCLVLTFIVLTMSKTDLATMTPLWLLPVLPAVIASTSGGLIAGVLDDPQHQLWTLIISYVLWGLSLPLALTFLVLYFHRLTVHPMLDKEVIVSAFLPIGPLGLGGYTLFLFGKVALKVFPATNALAAVPMAGEILYVYGFISSLIMWGFGIAWFFIAVATIVQARTFPFNMGWWSFTFPIGVCALSTIQIGRELSSSFFKVLGVVISVVVVLLWIVVAIGTVRDSLSGKVFYAPCLETDMRLKELKIRKAYLRTSGDKAG